MKIGFALIIDVTELEHLVSIENKIHNVASFHSHLSLSTNLPHTTIFQGTFTEDLDYKKVATQLAEFVNSKFESKVLLFDKINYVDNGWYFLMCKKTDHLQRLHEYALSLCQPYIIVEKNLKNIELNKLPKIQLENLIKYGYRYSNEAYLPHITIGRTDNSLDEKLLALLRKEFSNFSKSSSISRLTVYEMGLDGTHKKTLFEIQI